MKSGYRARQLAWLKGYATNIPAATWAVSSFDPESMWERSLR